MSRQRQQMLQGLVQRVHTIADDLRIEVPDFVAGGGDEEAAYTFFFEQFLGKLEGTAKEFNARVVESGIVWSPCVGWWICLAWNWQASQDWTISAAS